MKPSSAIRIVALLIIIIAAVKIGWAPEAFILSAIWFTLAEIMDIRDELRSERRKKE